MPPLTSERSTLPRFSVVRNAYVVTVMLEFEVSAATWPSSNLSTAEEDAPVITVSPWFTRSPVRSGRWGAVPVWTTVAPVTEVATAAANAASPITSATRASRTEILFMVLSPKGRANPAAYRACARTRTNDDKRLRAYHVSPKSAASPEGYDGFLRRPCGRWRPGS